MTLSFSPLSIAEVQRRRAARAEPVVELHDESGAVVELHDESEAT